MTSRCSVDFETRATVDLRKAGVYPYAAHHETDVWCMAYAFDDEEPLVWYLGEDFPERLRQHIADGGHLYAWNANFERVIWRDLCGPRYGWPVPALDQWYCTMAQARAMALPGGLEAAAKVLGIPQQKDVEGAKLMHKMTKPRDVRNILGARSVIWWDLDRSQLLRLGEYCAQDVRTERAAGKCLLPLVKREREIYLLDQIKNDRGIAVDVPLVEAALDIIEVGLEKANGAIRELTDGAVSGVTKLNDIKRWLLETETLPVTAMDKAAIREMLTGDLSAGARQVIELRAEAGRSSVAKLTSMLGAKGTDDIVRGLLQYHAATTGRWGGRLVQPQNFPRPTIDEIEWFIPLVLNREFDTIELFHSVFDVVVSMLRSMLTATPGCRLIAADFSAIEARVLNWIAGQWDYVDLFASGQDVYKLNGSRLYKIPIEEVQKFPHRQTGKFQELGCGFQMGKVKAKTAAKDVYGLELTDEEAAEAVATYRATHTKVVDFWHEIERAAYRAVERPGEVQILHPGGAPLKLVKRGNYLWLVLPSGRPLCYPAPAIKNRETPWSKEARRAWKEMFEAWQRGERPDIIEPVPRPEAEYRLCVECWGVNSMTKQWEPYQLYGGLLAENVAQAIARDLMAEAELRVEAAGYPVILSVHDEVVANVPAEFGSVDEFEALMNVLPPWAARCPVASEGWSGFRYRK